MLKNWLRAGLILRLTIIMILITPVFCDRRFTALAARGGAGMTHFGVIRCGIHLSWRGMVSHLSITVGAVGAGTDGAGTPTFRRIGAVAALLPLNRLEHVGRALVARA